MNKLIAFIEKGKAFFEKLSRNIYLRKLFRWIYRRDASHFILKYLYLDCFCTKLMGL